MVFRRPATPVFRKLQTKVTILYAALFILTLVAVAQAVAPMVTANAVNATKAELSASRTVFDRIFAMKSRELQGNAELLAKDFGFNSAVATADAPTIESALDNLRARRGIDHAFLVLADGRVLGGGAGALTDAARADLLRALADSDYASGVLQIAGVPCQTISAPVLAPQPIGWLVFANRLDRAQMQTFEHLSAIPLEARLLQRGPDGHWRDVANPQAPDAAAVDRFARDSTGTQAGQPRMLEAPTGKAVALVSPVRAVGETAPLLLLLRYPLDRALAPYGPLLAALGGLGLLSIAVLVAGSWALARSITRPVALLDSAVSALGEGARAEVSITTHDEIGRLASNFNTMSAAIVEREQRITDMALRDLETGLPNRTALEAEIGRLRSAPGGPSVAVIALAIDRLDVLRHAIGYQMLAELLGAVGREIRRLQPDVLCARVSTGRLALALPVPSCAAARELAEALLDGLAGPFEVGGAVVDVSLTVGLFTAGPDDAVIHDNRVMEHANIAIDQAQAAHQRLAAFDEQAYGDPARNLSLMSELAAARGNGELSLFYQPKYDLRTGRIAGFEALCRWRHATRGPISPDLFIVMAEETGNIEGLTEWVLERALVDQQALRAAGFDLPIAINLSGRVLGVRAFAERALNAIRFAGGRITMEITETAVIANPEEGLRVLRMFEQAGVPVSIDDYGSGLSSLAYLKQIQAQELKIDKAFVLLIDQNPRDRLLVKSTVDLAHGLGMRVVAEGVETAEALALLAGMGCDYAQGYHIARPMKLDDVLAFLRGFEAAPLSPPTPVSAAS